MHPIGPAPITSTSSPSTENDKRCVHRVVERIEDRHDVLIDPRPMRPDIRHRPRQKFGERTRPVHVEADRVRAEMAATRHALAAAATNDVTLTAHKITDSEICHIRSKSDYLANTFVVGNARGLHRPWRPCVPGVDV